MKKALIIATREGFIAQFEGANINYLQSLGYEVHCAINFNLPDYYSENLKNTNIVKHHIEFVTNPLSPKNTLAYKQLVNLMMQNKFDIVHVHNPISAALGRLAAHKTKIPHVIYTAHGFHFFKGGSLINQIFFYPVEKYLARYTDVLITINEEDYSLAKKKFKAGHVYKIPGVGLDLERFKGLGSVQKVKDELHINNNPYIILSVGEVNKNKNHMLVIKALELIKAENFIYIICGIGSEMKKLKAKVEKTGISDKVKILGFRSDVLMLNTLADLFVFPSYREGLSVALMEAMNTGIPVICSNIRGNKDLIDDEKGGYLIAPNDYKILAELIMKLMKNKKLSKEMGEYNMAKIQNFSLKNVQPIMHDIYDAQLN